MDAVEPDPTNVQVLRFNLWFNGVNGTVWPLALSTTPPAPCTSRTTSTTSETSGPGRGRQGGVAGRGRVAKWIVPAVSGDDLFAGRSFDLVKIDTQGWKFQILLGIDLTLRRSPGVRIVVEYCPQILKDRDRDPLQVLARYRELGYGILAIVHGAPVDLVDAEITEVCATGGSEGQVNLLLSR